MATETVNIFTPDGILTVVVDVPTEYNEPPLRDAYGDGAAHGIKAAVEAIYPELKLTQTGDVREEIVRRDTPPDHPA